MPESVAYQRCFTPVSFSCSDMQTLVLLNFDLLNNIRVKLLHRLCGAWASCVTLTQPLTKKSRVFLISIMSCWWRGWVPAEYRHGAFHSSLSLLDSAFEKVEAVAHQRPEVTAAGYIYDTLREWKCVWSWHPQRIWCQNRYCLIKFFRCCCSRSAMPPLFYVEIMKA